MWDRQPSRRALDEDDPLGVVDGVHRHPLVGMGDLWSRDPTDRPPVSHDGRRKPIKDVQWTAYVGVDTRGQRCDRMPPFDVSRRRRSLA